MSDIWKYENNEQKAEMESEVTIETCAKRLKLIKEISKKNNRDIANSFKCSEATIERLLKKETYPTEHFLQLLRVLSQVGFVKFSKMNDKERTAHYIAGGGSVVGAVGISSAIYGLGTVGFSAAGITSGLATMGGTMLGGIAVSMAAPLAAGGGVYAAYKYYSKRKILNKKDFDSRFEILPN